MNTRGDKHRGAKAALIGAAIGLVTAMVAVAPLSAAADRSIHTGAPGFTVGMRPFGAPVSLEGQQGFGGRFGFGNGPGSGSALITSTPVGVDPAAVAVDPATHTIYVANGFNSNGDIRGGNTVSVIDARHCNAVDVSRCKGPWPTITVGNDPSGVAIDPSTDTLYVANNADGTVSVVNGATCNGLTSSGCDQASATVPVGSGPIGLYADSANHTVYVANFGDVTVSMIDSATCDAADLQGCPTVPPPTVTVGGGGSGDVDVNQSTHTVYVATLSGLSVFDANTCNASVMSGCGSIGVPPVPGCDIANCGPFTAKVDPANNTIYESDGTTTVLVFDGRSCDAAHLAGCATDAPATVTPFPDPGFDTNVWVAVDAPLHTVYVTYEKDDILLVIDTNACNGSDLAACAALKPAEIHTGSQPESLALDPSTQTLYSGNEVDNTVSVIDPTRCDAQTNSGCRPRAPEVPIGPGEIGPGAMAADPGVATTYVESGADTASMAMIDTRDCNAFHPAGCSATPSMVTLGPNRITMAVHPATHTVYVADYGSGSAGTVSVFDDRTCNAMRQAGCGAVSTLQVPGGNADDIAVNAKTDTVYVATITSSGPDLLSVFNGATCNATSTVGCSQTPATVGVGNSGDAPHNSTLNIAVNPATNTVYAANFFNLEGPPPYLGNTVYVINGATCDAANTTGCGQTPAVVTIAANPPVGSNPWGIAVDQATDTIYTANIADGENPGTISVINGAICNGENASGCGQTPATAPAGFGTNTIAIDQTTNRIYASNNEDASITTLNGNTCNGTNTSGCGQARTRPVVGDYPGSIAVDPNAGTAYVADIEGVSVVPLVP